MTTARVSKSHRRSLRITKPAAATSAARSGIGLERDPTISQPNAACGREHLQCTIDEPAGAHLVGNRERASGTKSTHGALEHEGALSVRHLRQAQAGIGILGITAPGIAEA
jgi:hypothetical protein